MEFIDLKAQQARIRDRVEQRLRDVLDHGRYVLGPEVEELEQRLADYVGVSHCISCANGTDALVLALMALGIGPDDEVIVPAFSFIASAEAVCLVGARPVFVDIEPHTCNIDSEAIEAAINSRTRAIMAVSLYGQCPDFDAIDAIAGKHQLPVIEDAAQSFGAERRGRKSCAQSLVGCTSFFPAKPLGAYGDGGALFTDDAELAREIRMHARHGEVSRYHHDRVGMNSRLDTMQAAVLLEKLAIFPDEVERRRRAGEQYHRLLEGANLTLPVVPEASAPVWGQYTLRVAERDRVQAALKEEGIPTAIHYPKPMHWQAAYRTEQSLPESERASREVISLPMHPYLEDADIERVAAAVRRAVGEGS